MSSVAIRCRGYMMVACLIGGALAAGPGCRRTESGGTSEADPAPNAAEVPASDPTWFVESAADRGIDFRHDSGHRERFYMCESACGGAALFDMDDDGDLDAYLVQSGNIEDPPARRPANRLYRNDGSGRFTDVTEGSGADDRGYGMGVAAGDYDNDGDVDLYVTNVGPNILLANDGTGVFRDVTETAVVGGDEFSSSAAFVDYDHDGDLDLYVVNYLDWSPATELECRDHLGDPDYCSPIGYDAPTRDTLYRNGGAGTFDDVTVSAGLSGVRGTGLGVVAGDFDADGLVDLFVANDGMPDRLWVNQGEGRFEEKAMLAGCAIDQDGKAKAGMGVAAADIDEDGDEDLLVVNLLNETDSFFRNEGDFFVDDTAIIGLGSASRPFTRFGLAVLDFDNDGMLDVYQASGRVARQARRWTDDPYAEPNILLRGTPAGRFEEVEPRGGTGQLLVAASRAAAFGDVDNDGGLDILITNRDGPAHLLLNRPRDDRHWLLLRVIENGRDAVGAQVEIRIGDRTLTRTVRSAFSYCAANDPRVHVGLGEVDAVDDISVRWVDGTVESFGGREADAIVELRKGSGR